jgi:hypothetical protein
MRKPHHARPDDGTGHPMQELSPVRLHASLTRRQTVTLLAVEPLVMPVVCP